MPMDAVEAPCEHNDHHDSSAQSLQECGKINIHPYKPCKCAVKVGSRCSDISETTISMVTPPITTAFPSRPLHMSAELLLHRRRPYCAAMVTLWRSHCALIKHKWRHLFCAYSKCLTSFAIPRHLLVMPLRHCGTACDSIIHTSAFCIFLGCHWIAVRSQP